MRAARLSGFAGDLGMWQFRGKSLLLLIAAPIPICSIVTFLAALTVNTPWADGWEHVPWFEKLAQNTLALQDLFAQHSEYRQFFRSAVFLFLAWLSSADFRLPIVFGLLLACIVLFNIYRLAASSHSMPSAARLTPCLAAIVLIFSPVQYENWLQGQQLIYFVSVACLTTALPVMASETLSRPMKFLLCALLTDYRSLGSSRISRRLRRETTNAQLRVITMAAVERGSHMVSAVFRQGCYRDVRWRKSVSSRERPPGAVRVTAGAFDAHTGKTYPLDGSDGIHNSAALREQARS